MMKLAGVVVVYNPGDGVLKSINSYIDDLDILYVIDNSSFNNAKLFNNDKIKYIPNMDNLGIAKALNIGAKLAIKDKYKYLLTMDQDSKFEKNGLAKLKKIVDDYENNDELVKLFGKNKNKIGIFTPIHVINNDTSIMGMPSSKFDSPVNVMTSGNIINLDLSRTFQEISLFKEKNILTMLYNVLYIYTKENINKNAYKQGMNEIISILFLSIYPYYTLPKKSITRIDIINI